jgi:hypothetical protein
MQSSETFSGCALLHRLAEADREQSGTPSDSSVEADETTDSQQGRQE